MNTGNVANSPIQANFDAFTTGAFADGALSRKSKELMAVAVAHAIQCRYCIEGHTRRAMQAGASKQELIEAFWVAIALRSGSIYSQNQIMRPIMQPAPQ